MFKRIMENLNMPMMLVIFGVLLSGFGAFWATYQQNQEKMQSANNQVKFQTELREKSDEIANLNREIADSVTGGNSYCFITMYVTSEKTAKLMLVQKGEHPLYDVVVAIVEPEKLDNVKTLDEFNSQVTNFRPGNLTPNIVYPIGDIELPDKDSIDYHINIYARNGSFSQLLKMEKVSGVWEQAMRLHKGESVLHEQIDDNFPKDKDGNIDWK